MEDFIKINDCVVITKKYIDNISYSFMKEELEIEIRYPYNQTIIIYPFDKSNYDRIMNEMEKYIKGSDE